MFSKHPDDAALARRVAEAVRKAGGRAFFVGGCVRDALMGRQQKDYDIEVYGLEPSRLRAALAPLGEVFDKGAAFSVLGIRHSGLDIAMPRRETLTGVKHTDFDIAADPFLSFETACSRRDFTVNAMLRDILTGEIIDPYGGQKDLQNRLLRPVSAATFGEDPLRVFRAGQFAARLNFQVTQDGLDLCRGMEVTHLSRERVYEETNKALLQSDHPSVYFRFLRECGHLREFFPEVEALIGVQQNPAFHPEGDVFEHTMLVLDAAATHRAEAQQPLHYMYAALLHDVGKPVASSVKDGRIISYGHPEAGVPLAEKQLRRLSDNSALIAYVKNMVLYHMQPNLMAHDGAGFKATRKLFDKSVCPRDLVWLARADGEGQKAAPYSPANWAFTVGRLIDYEEIVKQPMVTGQDLIALGVTPSPQMKTLLERARLLLFSGLDKPQILKQLQSEINQKHREDTGA